mmetsp:Transcript_10535/g.24450  ORF Transcript_10535/g.24450 Transcript_10535/m.24450 type:complete len:469 (-) Transcript_10535:5160-6566(-)
MINHYQEAYDTLLTTAEKAHASLCTFTSEQLNNTIDALAKAAKVRALYYAKWSVEETGYGNVEDNVKKYQDCMTNVIEKYNPSDFVDPRVDYEKKIIHFPKPIGVILTLIPSTNPIMTIYYETVISIMTRNAIIFSPHPKAAECSLHAANFMSSIAESTGIPSGAIQIMSDYKAGIAALDYLMGSPKVNLIMATGGINRVKAAYSSGKPAFGMGPGNVPCFIHKSADLATAAVQTIESNSFDHALPCIAESVVIADKAINNELRERISSAGGYFVQQQDAQKFREYLFPQGVLNKNAIGKSATWIAQQVRINIPPDTKSLLITMHEISSNDPISREKMFPVMGYISVDSLEGGIDIALKMLDITGKGHSAIIHSNDFLATKRYAAALPVCRIIVNAGGIEGSGGFSTNLNFGPLVGTGFFGGSSVDENIGPQHLVQYSRLAYTKDSEMLASEKSIKTKKVYKNQINNH